jgi:(heptosyl)LPS beta-1,4-glucosyltransferase
MRLTAIILTKNEARQIVPCVESLAWADEVVAFDCYSDDGTAALAEGAGARVIQLPFRNFAQQRNAALDAIESDSSTLRQHPELVEGELVEGELVEGELVEGELAKVWVFFVDADERATPELGREIRQVIEREDVNGWWVPRHNYIFGRLTRGAGYFPDYQMRLLRAGCGRYERPASEIVVLEGADGHLKQPLIHYNYETIAQFHAKQRARETFEATTLHRQGVRLRPHTFLLQPMRHFLWRYVTLKGYQDGWHGLRLCMLLAYYHGWRNYVRLRHMRRSGELPD